MAKNNIHKFVFEKLATPGLLLLITFIVAMKQAERSDNSAQRSYSYLALGDSYTIGEQVEAKDNFPNQLCHILNQGGTMLGSPEIIAQTGWTTDELAAAIKKARLSRNYNFVTLLIGVNNQYRARSVGDYIREFESLLKQAIQFAGNKSDHVIVLSIPDWGATPFAAGRDRDQIGKEIDAYNTANEKVAKDYHVPYINITQSTREAATDLSLLAPDGLHPSAKEYTIWAKKLATFIQEKL